ncbi:hypothetical protein LTR04_002550 [Oleoguttula sp. CCFEE 6159]|nr:hypothetical protein LTR04_002550 [Oleoguttula sp. CCFEE 6159]
MNITLLDYLRTIVNLNRSNTTFKIAGINHVDITRDVGNLAHVHFAANVFSITLKTKEHPRGISTEHEMYMALAVIFTCIFFDLDPLGALVETNVKMVNLTSMVAGVVDGMMSNHQYLTDYGVHMVRRLLESGMGAEEVAWSQVLPTATPMVPNQSQVPWNFYLSPAGSKYLPDIDRLARMDTPEADDKILHYCIEGIRLNGTFGSYRESAATTLIDDGGRAVHVKPGDKVFVSFVGAAKDTVVFPDPRERASGSPTGGLHRLRRRSTLMPGHACFSCRVNYDVEDCGKA